MKRYVAIVIVLAVLALAGLHAEPQLSAGGTRAFVATSRGVIHVWDTGPLHAVADAAGTWVSWAPDSYFAGTENAIGRLRNGRQ